MIVEDVSVVTMIDGAPVTPVARGPSWALLDVSQVSLHLWASLIIHQLRSGVHLLTVVAPEAQTFYPLSLDKLDSVPLAASVSPSASVIIHV